MKSGLSLPRDWNQALKRGQGVAAELTVDAAEIQAQALAEAFLSDRKAGSFFFLETQDLSRPSMRFSLIAGEPLFSFVARGRRGIWQGGELARELSQTPEQAFEALGRGFRTCGLLESEPGLSPLLGWLSYEAGSRFENLPLAGKDPLGMPDWYLMLPGEWAWLDVEQKKWRFRKLLADRPFYSGIQAALGLHHGVGESPAMPQPEKVLESWQEGVQARLTRARMDTSAANPVTPRSLAVADNVSREEFCQSVEKAREYISSGDIFQVNLSHRQTAPYSGRAWQLYRRLGKVNPSPYACFAELGSYQIISASPERMFSQDGCHVETHPIAGTIALEKGPEALKLSEKDRAEHIMTVDIERNDLGRVCDPGSVRVRDLMALETYSHLHHLVSRVEGKLREGNDLPDLFRAGFPGGSVTGAPKIRCMEIISELEGERRGVYTGSLGYWDPIHRKSDFNILIRTILLGQGKAVWQVGAGIVADSDPQKEWDETLAKAAALRLALETAPL